MDEFNIHLTLFSDEITYDGKKIKAIKKLTRALSLDNYEVALTEITSTLLAPAGGFICIKNFVEN